MIWGNFFLFLLYDLRKLFYIVSLRSEETFSVLFEKEHDRRSETHCFGLQSIDALTGYPFPTSLSLFFPLSRWSIFSNRQSIAPLKYVAILWKWRNQAHRSAMHVIWRRLLGRRRSWGIVALSWIVYLCGIANAKAKAIMEVHPDSWIVAICTSQNWSSSFSQCQIEACHILVACEIRV